MVAPTEAPLDVATADGSISTWSHLTKNRQKYSSPPFVFTIHDRQSPPLTAMSAAGKQPETLTFDSAALYLRFYAAVFSQPPPIPATFPPLPSSLPHPKLIPKTRFIIDGFKHAGEFSVSYFLSHFHSDHYTGLSPAWSKGVIYCSSITARLLVEVLKVPGAFVVPLPCNERVLVDGCEVCLVDANHCPGAVQFLFKVPTDGGKFEKYVHTGDFRYCDTMKMIPLLNEFVGSDAVFLDTTYCNPKYVFPAQQESIDYIVEVIDRIGAENEGNAKNVLFLVATYVIGKEKILMEISRRCKRKIHVDARKMNVLSVLGMGESGMFSEDASESDVHVVGWNVLGETWPYFRPNFVSLKEVMEERGYSKVVGFVPTGWTYEVKKTKFAVRKKDSFEIHLVPYSEHSNYEELREYVKFLNPKRVIPTVGIDVEKLDSKHVDKLTKHFAGLVDVNAAKQEFLMGFYKKAREDDGNDDTSPQQQKAETVSEVDIEDCLKELGDCLPSWVTQSQMVDLLVTSKHNVVEAVSNFYEHETEFYEQVADTLSPPSLHLQDSLPSKLAEDESRTFYKPRGVESGTSAICSPVNVPSKTQGVSVSDRLKQPTTVNTAKNKSSPGKRKRAAENKTSKKVKSTASSGHTPKQHTITKFFQKIAVNVSQDEEAAAASQPSQDDKVAGAPRPSKDDDDTSIPSDTIESFKAVVDQFIHIVNGDESLRRQASMILKKTDGNVNLALDIYYGGSGASIDGNNVSLPEKIGEVQSRSSMKNSFTECENPKLKKLGSASDASIAVQQIDNTATDYVSLPLEKYSPVEHACWKKGEPAPFLHLARTFDLVEEEKGKIKATIMLCNMFRSLLSLSPEDVLPAVYLCLNKIAPDHENMELNIGSSIIVAALEDACGTNKSKVRDMYNSLGDLGDVAQLCRQTQTLLIPPAALTIRGVFYVMRRISSQTGPGSMALKKIFIVNLMRSCREKEMKFLVRMLVRNLRIGAMLKTVLPALAQAVVMNSPEVSGENLKHHLKCLSAAVIEAYNILPHLDVLIASLIEKGIQFSSTTLSMVPGVPIKPMLAKIAHGSSQVLKLFENKAFTCEYKYDGQRAQIHRLEDGSFHIFSRNGDETTAKFPDLLNIMKEACGSVLTSFILDTEVVAVDRKKSNKLMSFQELSSRERGSKDSTVSLEKIKVDICVFIFDIMFMDGKQLLGTTLRERRKYLKDLFGQEKPGYIEYANEMTVEATDADTDNETTTSAINSFLDDALRSSCEGIMVKTLDVDAGYTPSKRSDAWLKVKKDYVEGLNDSLDLVPIGAWHGNGRKAGWYSPFLMACYDPDREEFQSVCRVMSGFSDSFYKEMKEFFSEDKIVAKKPPYYQTAEVPDVWFSAELVWAIRGAELSVSPVHQAAIGLVHPSRGISMRFPRFLWSVSDRNPEDCSTAADIADMFNSQTRKMEVNMKQIKQ